MPTCDLIFKRATTDNELRQILTLQKLNSKAELSERDQIVEGFVTVNHDLIILKKMNDTCQHVIAKDGDMMVGYALVMTQEFKQDIAVLAPMFDAADELLPKTNYIAMGQICIAKPYRKMGLFKEMYDFFRTELQSDFDCVFTEVATTNARSLEAHKSIGFKVLKTQITHGISWQLMNWDWR